MKTLRKIFSLLVTVVMVYGMFGMTNAGAYTTIGYTEESGYDPVYNAVDYRTEYLPLKTVTQYGGSAKDTETYKYDDKNRLIEYVMTSADGIKKHIMSKKYSYDSKGNIIGEVYTFKAGIITEDYEKITRTFDKSGRVTKETTLQDVIGKDKTISEYRYTDSGKLASSVTKNYTYGKNTTIENDEYKYNKSGNVTKYVNSYADKETKYTKTVSYTYDKNGNILSEKTVDNATLPEKYTETTTVTNTYDTKGRLVKSVEKTVDSDNYKTTTSTKNTYDKHGDKIKSVISYSDEYTGPSDTVITCTYDSKHRLIKSVTKTDEYGDRMMFTESYVFDKNGNCTKQSVVEESFGMKTSSVVKTTYDSKNRIKTIEDTTDIKIGSEEARYSHINTYNYDKNGNVIREVVKDNDFTSTISHTYKKLDKKVAIVDGSILMSASIYTYNGKAKKPAITIMDMLAGKDYTVSYKNNVKVGTAQAVITFANKNMVKDGSGVVTINYKIKK